MGELASGETRAGADRMSARSGAVLEELLEIGLVGGQSEREQECAPK